MLINVNTNIFLQARNKDADYEMSALRYEKQSCDVKL